MIAALASTTTTGARGMTGHCLDLLDGVALGRLAALPSDAVVTMRLLAGETLLMAEQLSRACRIELMIIIL
jgi:hypothetical protein